MLRYAALSFELKRVMSELYKNGERVILDYAKENVSLSSAMRIRQTTETMIDTIPKGSMCALKLTSFGSRESPSQAKHHVSKLIQHAKMRGVSVCIDAEDVLYPDLCYSLMHEHNTSTYTHVYNTYQMYRRDAIDDMMRDIDRTKKDEIMIGIKLMVVKIKILDSPLFKRETEDMLLLVVQIHTGMAYTIIFLLKQIQLVNL